MLFTHEAPDEIPDGWSAAPRASSWTLRWDTVLSQDLENQPAPYPALVSIGLDEHGATWLLNLETVGICGIAGPQQQAADLTRFIVAELAVNAWSLGADVLLTDQFASDTIGLNPTRLRQVERSTALARAQALTSTMDEAEENLAADLSSRRRDGMLLDTTGPVVLVVSSPPTGPFVESILNRDQSRVVVVHNAEGGARPLTQCRWSRSTATGRPSCRPGGGVRLEAFLLSAPEAHAMAALLASTRNLADEPVPTTQSDDGPLGPYALADGGLREEYTAPRHTAGGDPSSQLPDADATYLANAATTSEDLAAVAPSIPETTRAQIETLDPTLDQDVTD